MPRKRQSKNAMAEARKNVVGSLEGAGDVAGAVV
jgi:hypothetical protein